MASIFIQEQEDHEFKLDQYEGPLDLLLSMIKEAKIDIKDIFLSKITDQYIEYIRSMKILDIEKASDFVSMAATLLEIKSKELLPQIEELDNEEYVDEKHELQRQLEMYSIIQETTVLLQEKETKNRFYRQPVYSDDDCRLIFKGSSYDKLLDAFANVLYKVDYPENDNETKNIEKDSYTVAEKVMYIADFISNAKSVSFYQLFTDDNSKSSILNTFLALLELLKRQVISAVQDDIFGDIKIEIKEGADLVSLEDFINEQSN